MYWSDGYTCSRQHHSIHAIITVSLLPQVHKFAQICGSGHSCCLPPKKVFAGRWECFPCWKMASKVFTGWRNTTTAVMLSPATDEVIKQIWGQNIHPDQLIWMSILLGIGQKNATSTDNLVIITICMCTITIWHMPRDGLNGVLKWTNVSHKCQKVRRFWRQLPRLIVCRTRTTRNWNFFCIAHRRHMHVFMTTLYPASFAAKQAFLYSQVKLIFSVQQLRINRCIYALQQWSQLLPDYHRLTKVCCNFHNLMRSSQLAVVMGEMISQWQSESTEV